MLQARPRAVCIAQAHTLLGAHNFGVSEEKLADVWQYSTSPLFTEKEKLALDFALAAASQPNAVTDELFALMKQRLVRQSDC